MVTRDQSHSNSNFTIVTCSIIIGYDCFVIIKKNNARI